MKHLKDWEKYFDSKGIKRNLVRTSFFLVLYEMLRNSVVDRVKDFYLVGFGTDGDKYSDNYVKYVANRKIEGRQHIFLSSLYWLQENGAISEEDIKEISEVRELRNKVAHQIDRILTDSEFELEEKLEERVFKLIKKIELWWIINVEIPTDLDTDESEVAYDGIIPGKEIFYQHIKGSMDDLIDKINNE